jgi:hypothetical protein
MSRERLPVLHARLPAQVAWLELPVPQPGADVEVAEFAQWFALPSDVILLAAS